MMRALGLILIILPLAACDQAVDHYVRDSVRNPAQVPPVETPAEALPGQSLRVSPGSIDATSGPLRMKAGINGQSRDFSMGADRRAKLSLGRTRVAPQ